MADKVIIGCKIPNGLILQVGEQCVNIKGANSSRLVFGYGVTSDVSLDFWEAWLAENKDRDLVKNGLIFANNDVKSTKDNLKDGQNNPSGLEPLDPDQSGEVTRADK